MCQRICTYMSLVLGYILIPSTKGTEPHLCCLLSSYRKRNNQPTNFRNWKIVRSVLSCIFHKIPTRLPPQPQSRWWNGFYTKFLFLHVWHLADVAGCVVGFLCAKIITHTTCLCVHMLTTCMPLLLCVCLLACVCVFLSHIRFISAPRGYAPNGICLRK